VRILLAPTYTRMAIEHDPRPIVDLLSNYPALPDAPDAFSAFDWRVHQQLTICSGNPVFTLILNGFQDLYKAMGLTYFSLSELRDHSRHFYRALLACSQNRDGSKAYSLTETVMKDSLANWKNIVI
jgi:GntR family negative regulator for fad regulon and positive regulator of fabA